MSEKRAAARHQSRRLALQVLYAVDLAHPSDPQASGNSEVVFDRVASNFDLQEGAREFAQQLVRGVDARREELDAQIAAHARNWRVSRMAAVDRNLLRLAAYELVHTDTPDAVVLDEAVQLAHAFGAERTPSFVNGVLDAISRELREEGTGGAANDEFAACEDPS